ncbi:MAG: hypothetical protein ACOC1F_13395, partial [Myxococcota bacterium]
VSVMALASDTASRQATRSIARTVAERIQQEGPIPGLVALLPLRGLLVSQVHYFHTWALLTRYYQFGRDNLLELGGDTEGLIARYRTVDEQRLATLLVVRYPSNDRGANAHGRFLQGYLAGTDAEIECRDERWVGFVRRDRLLLGVFDAVERGQVVSLIDEVTRWCRGAS